MTSLAENLRALEAGEKLVQHKPAKKRLNGKAVIKPRSMDENTIRMFCLAYIKHGLNGAAAYKASHPKASTKTASVEASRYLANPSVQEILQPMLRELFAKAKLDADFVLKRWLSQSRASPLDYFKITKDGKLGGLDLSNITEDQRLNLKAIKVTKNKFGESTTVTVCDQAHAVDMLAKYLGLLVEKLPEAGVERIGDMLERAVKRIKATKDLDGWKDIVLDAEFTEVR